MRVITQYVTNISLNSFGAEHYYGISCLGIIIGTYFYFMHEALVKRTRKLKTWVYLRHRLARPCVHALALTCDYL